MIIQDDKMTCLVEVIDWRFDRDTRGGRGHFSYNLLKVLKGTHRGNNEWWNDEDVWRAEERTENDVFCVDGQCAIQSINPKENAMSISAIAKRLLDKDTRTLVKAGFLDSELDLTEKGQEALDAINFEEQKAKLVKMAEEELAEEESE